MPNNKHKITKERAKQLTEHFKGNRKASSGKFRNIPDGFIFPIETIRELISHPDAKHFVMQLGWNPQPKQPGSGPNVTPVLFVTDDNYKALPELQPLGSGTSAFSATTSYAASLDSGGGGGFVNEGGAFPPPPVSLGD